MHSPGILVTVLGFLLLLGPLVFVHEFGHYLVARWCGVKADVFSIGFGRELVGLTDKRGTRWKLSVLPLGGYVQFAGDMNPASQADASWLALPAWEREATFQAKPLWKRALIVAAGPATNFLFAILVLAAFEVGYGRIVAAPVIGKVEAGSVAEKAGLKPGDRIVEMLGKPMRDFMAIKLTVTAHPAEQLSVVVDRAGQRVAIPVVSGTKDAGDGSGAKARIGYLGIGPQKIERQRVNPAIAVVDATRQVGDIVGMMTSGIGQIVSGQRSAQELSGPIRIAQVSGQELSLGWRNFIWFTAFVSINLGFINLLPIPILDGGHLALYALEAVRRKPISGRGQEWAFRAGFALVLALMLFVTVNDLASLARLGG